MKNLDFIQHPVNLYSPHHSNEVLSDHNDDFEPEKLQATNEKPRTQNKRQSDAHTFGIVDSRQPTSKNSSVR